MTGKPTYEELEQRVKELGKICRENTDASALEHKTERKRSEEDRRKSERRYRHLLEGLPDIVWSFSDKRGILFASGRVEKIIGYSPEYLYKNPWLWNQSIHPDDKNDVDKAIACFAAGKDLDVEYRVKDASGNWLWFHDRSIDRRMEGDEVIIEGISTDITERKLAEETLIKEKEMAQTYLDIAGVIFVAINRLGEVILINKKGCEVLGYDEKYILGKNWFDHFIPAWSKEELIPVSKKLLNGDIQLEEYHENLILTKTGEERIIAWHNTILRDDEGNIIAHLSSGEDITERKRAEEALRQAENNFRRSLDDSPLGVRIVTMKGETIYANRAILEIYGYDSLDELRTTPVKKRYTPESYAEFRIRKKKRQQGVYSPPEYEISIVNKNGEVRHLQVFRKEILWNGERQFQVIYRDITKRKLAEDALRESEERFSTIFNSSPVSIAIARVKNQQLFDVNDAWQIITGFTKEEAIGRSPIELNLWINPDERNRLINRLLEEETVDDLEVQIRHKSGRVIDMLMSGKLIDIAGEQFLLTLAQDITEQKRIMDLLRESEQRYRGLFDSSLIGVSQALPNGRLIAANQSYASMYGYDTPQEMMKEVTDIGKQLYANLNDRRAVLQELSEKGVLKPREFAVCRRDGTQFFVMVAASEVRDADGRLLCYQATHIDVTDRKRMEEELRISEALYRELFENCGAAITIVDQNGKYLLINEMAAKAFGKSPKEIMGKSICDFFQEALANIHLRANRILIENGGSREYEETLMLPVGERTYRIIDRCIKDAKGHNIAIQGSSIDITDRVMAERERECLQSELFQSRKMETLGTLVAGVAHEINNPINTIMNNAPLLRRVWKDLLPLVEERAEKEPGRRYGGLTASFLKENLDQLISDIDMAANRVASVVKGLKDYSRKTTPLKKQQVDINVAVENAIRLAGSTVKKSGITLALDLTPNLPSINADLQNIEQIIMNLMVNAVQAIEHDHGEIRITTTHNKNQGTIVLSVQDNGKGISPAISDKIFDPFFTEWQSKGGTGLGLPITQNLVKANDGEITFKSRMGKGTAFLVSFTVERKKKAFKILLVDDNEAVLEIVKQALTIERHYMVEQASGGNEALIKIGIYHPDLLILDIFMPQMDGVEVCRAIQKHPELYDLKVIIFTGYPEHEKVKEVAEMGFTKVIAKPFQLQEFLKEVDRMLRI
jgi:PAS domain S-box-containing protein